jgi:hypothetical protein
VAGVSGVLLRPQFHLYRIDPGVVKKTVVVDVAARESRGCSGTSDWSSAIVLLRELRGEAESWVLRCCEKLVGSPAGDASLACCRAASRAAAEQVYR